MIVGNRMSKPAVSVTPDEHLDAAQKKMSAGRFRRVPVVSDGRLVGIITDRDLREHTGHLERTKISAVMSDQPISVMPGTTLEEAAQILLTRQIGGLPVVDKDKLIGIITTSDVMKAFLDVMGASEEASTRIDFVLQGEEHGFQEASRIVSREGGEILGVGTYRGKLGNDPVCYLRLAKGQPDHIAKALRQSGFDVLGVHQAGG